jgi:hypothetical protein
MTSLNLASNNLGVEGAKIVAAFHVSSPITKSRIPDALRLISLISSDTRAMTSLHVGMNSIPEKEMKEIITIAMRKDSMKILCEVPIKDKTLTELDISGKNLGMEGALVVAGYLDGNGALTSLDISENSLYAEGTKLLAEAAKSNQIMTALNFSSNGMTYDGSNYGDMSGVATLADAIPGMGAMTSLNLASNDLCSEGAKIVAAVLPKCM